MKKFLNFLVCLLTGKGDFTKEAIEAGAVNLSGQGRNRYGK